MHAYAIDSNERKLIPAILALVSVSAAYSLDRVIAALSLAVPWWLDTPSVLGFYGIFYLCFDKYVWRWSLLRRFGLVSLPNLNGTWEGTLTSSYDEHDAQHPVTIKVSQTWRHMAVRLETTSSLSCSESAALRTQDACRHTLSYEYFNEPKALATSTMHAHRGTARLTADQESSRSVLRGEYYTGRDRQMYGTLRLERAESA